MGVLQWWFPGVQRLPNQLSSRALSSDGSSASFMVVSWEKMGPPSHRLSHRQTKIPSEVHHRNTPVSLFFWKGIAAYRWQVTPRSTKSRIWWDSSILIEWGTKEYFQNLWYFHDLIPGSILNWKNTSMIWRTCGTFRCTLPPRVWVVIYVCHMIQHNK